MTKISIVLPSYNDREIIIPYYEAITEELARHEAYEFQLVYVDDGSGDGSQGVLADLAEADPRVTYVELFRNYGQQRALFAGIGQASGDIVVTLDGDFQYPPEVVMQMAAPLESGDYDMASGIRMGRKGSLKERLTSRIGGALINRMLCTTITDFGSVKAFTRDMVERILSLKHYYSDVYVSGLSLGPRMAEVEVRHLDRPVGNSHWNLWKRIMLWTDLYIQHGENQFEYLIKASLAFTVLGGLFGPALALYKTLYGHQMSYALILAVWGIATVLGAAGFLWSIAMRILLRLYKQNISCEPVVVRRTR